jgi:hypothetical protein
LHIIVFHYITQKIMEKKLKNTSIRITFLCLGSSKWFRRVGQWINQWMLERSKSNKLSKDYKHRQLKNLLGNLGRVMVEQNLDISLFVPLGQFVLSNPCLLPSFYVKPKLGVAPCGALTLCVFVRPIHSLSNLIIIFLVQFCINTPSRKTIVFFIVAHMLMHKFDY